MEDDASFFSPSISSARRCAPFFSTACSEQSPSITFFLFDDRSGMVELAACFPGVEGIPLHKIFANVCFQAVCGRPVHPSPQPDVPLEKPAGSRTCCALCNTQSTPVQPLRLFLLPRRCRHQISPVCAEHPNTYYVHGGIPPMFGFPPALNFPQVSVTEMSQGARDECASLFTSRSLKLDF